MGSKASIIKKIQEWGGVPAKGEMAALLGVSKDNVNAALLKLPPIANALRKKARKEYPANNPLRLLFDLPLLPHMPEVAREEACRRALDPVIIETIERNPQLGVADIPRKVGSHLGWEKGISQDLFHRRRAKNREIGRACNKWLFHKDDISGKQVFPPPPGWRVGRENGLETQRAPDLGIVGRRTGRIGR